MRLFLLVTAIILVSASLAYAAPTHPNEVGLYMTPDGQGATGTSEIGVIVDVHLVLTKPTNTTTGLPVTSIRSFECQLNFSAIPYEGLYKISPETYPGEAISVGDNMNLNDGKLEYVVGFLEEIPVVDESVVLVTIPFLLLTTTEIFVSLGPTDTSSIPGQICYEIDFGSARVMHPVSGAPNAPVFHFNGEAVAVERGSFGSVKALYR